MGWDGNGTFSRARNFSADASAGINAEAQYVDEEFDNFASALNLCLTRDGQLGPNTDLEMNARNWTNVGAPSSATQVPRAADVPIYVGLLAKNSNNHYSANFFGNNVDPELGQAVYFIATGTCSAGPTFTLGASSTADIYIQNSASNALIAVSSGLITTGGVYTLVWTGTRWVIPGRA